MEEVQVEREQQDGAPTYEETEEEEQETVELGPEEQQETKEQEREAEKEEAEDDDAREESAGEDEIEPREGTGRGRKGCAGRQWTPRHTDTASAQRGGVAAGSSPESAMTREGECAREISPNSFRVLEQEVKENLKRILRCMFREGRTP